MTELSLIFGLVVGVLLFTAGLLRWLLSLESGGAEARKLSGAVQRAAGTISWRQTKRGAAVTAGLVVLTLSVGPLRGESVSERAGWLVLGLAVGALLSASLSQAFLLVVTRGADRLASAMHGPSGMAVVLGLRIGAVLGLLAETAALILAASALFPLSIAEPNGSQTTRVLLGGLAVGVLVPALVNHLSSSAVYFSGQLGRRDPLFRCPRNSYQLAAQNPTMVLDLVGSHLAQGVVRAQTGFCGSLLVHVASLLAVLELSGNAEVDVAALVGLPLLIRAVGLVGCGFAVMATRVDDAEDVLGSLFRGQLSAALLSLSGVWGACYWFLGDTAFLPLAVTGSIGLFGALVVSFATRLSLQRGAGPLERVRESAKLNAALALTATLASAFVRTLGPLCGMLVSIVGLHLAGVAGAALGLSLAVMLASFSSAGAYSAALSGFEPLIDSASGLLSIDERHRRPDLQSRVSGLRLAAQGAGAIGRAQAQTETAFAGIGVAFLLWGRAFLDPSSPSVLYALLGGLFGTGLVLGYSGAVINHVARTAKALKLELVHQLRGFARNSEGYLELPGDFRPRYKDYLDQVGEGALGHSAQIIAGTLLAPIAAGIALVFRDGDSTAKHESALLLMAFVGFATLTGLCLSLLSSSAAATWGSAVRDVRLDSAEPAKARALIESGMCLTEVATPMAQLIVASAAALSIAVLAMIF